jgi:hypothetical protein
LKKRFHDIRTRKPIESDHSARQSGQKVCEIEFERDYRQAIVAKGMVMIEKYIARRGMEGA